MMLLLLTLVLSVCLCGAYLKLARRWQILDMPNDRSSHVLATPHGGGVPMLIAFFCGAGAFGIFSSVWPQSYIQIGAITLLLMLVGVCDDLKNLSVKIRFGVYVLCCLGGALLLLKPSGTGEWLIAVFASFALLWFINLYNFMDGIDGIAALQCILACVGAAILGWVNTADVSYLLICLLLAAAQLGFLVWNWSPARLFMGDAGSIPTGFLLGTLALLGSIQGQLPLACWLILVAAFITDASVTLFWRLVTGQAITEAHRSHAYQRLSRHWGSHQAVDLTLVALTLVWLFPLAYFSLVWPQYSLIIVILAYVPLALAMAKIAKLR